MSSFYINLDGNQGPTGATGATGPGVPTGGAAGDYLSKNSSTNYDTSWSNFEADVEQVMTDSTQPVSTSSTITVKAGTTQEIEVGERLLDLSSTSVESGGIISIDSGNTKYSVQAGLGYIVDHVNSTIEYVSWSAKNAVTPGLSGIVYLSINSSGNLVESNTAPTPITRRSSIFIGRIVVRAGTILAALTYPVISDAPASQIYDILNALGVSRSTGGACSANGANLSIDVTACELLIAGINYANNPNNPHIIQVAAKTAATFQHITQTAATGTNVTTISPGNYDVAGTITAIPGSNNQATNMRIYLFPSGNVRIAYGQTIYSTLAQAIAAVPTEQFITNPDIPGNGILIAILSVTKGATALNNTAQASFLAASKLGETIGSSAANAPSISTDPTLGFRIVENWISTTAVGNNGWTATANSGTVGMNASTGSGTIMGIVRCDSGTTSATAAPTLSLGNGTSMVLGGATVDISWRINVQALSTLTEEFIIRVGLSSATNGTAPANAVIFEYDRLNSVNWRLRGWANSVAGTVTTSSTAVVASTWTTLRIVVNSASTLATFYYNGSSIGTIATGIPSGTGQTVSPCIQLIKSAGTGSRNVYADWMTLDVVY